MLPVAGPGFGAILCPNTSMDGPSFGPFTEGYESKPAQKRTWKPDWGTRTTPTQPRVQIEQHLALAPGGAAPPDPPAGGGLPPCPPPPPPPRDPPHLVSPGPGLANWGLGVAGGGGIRGAAAPPGW